MDHIIVASPWLMEQACSELGSSPLLRPQMMSRPLIRLITVSVLCHLSGVAIRGQQSDGTVQGQHAAAIVNGARTGKLQRWYEALAQSGGSTAVYE